MVYLENLQDLKRRSTGFYARSLTLLDALCHAAGRGGRGRSCHLDSGFRPLPDYAILCQLWRAAVGKLNMILFGLFLAFSGLAHAATINARSPSFSDVSTAVATAAKGDTVVVPGGTASWTKTLVISKPITLMGQTTVNYTTETANNQTIILDDVSPRNPIIHADVTSGDMTVAPTVPLLQIKGFTFRGSPNTTSNSPIAAIQLSGTCPAVRITDCNFDSLYQASIYTFGWVYGVMDNCLHTIASYHVTGVMGMATYNGQKYGDGSWTEDAHWGSYKFFFIENNVIRNLFKSAGVQAGTIDAKRGARYVIRNSKIYDSPVIQTHGTEGDRDRGCRAIEFYNNVCTRSTDGPGSPGGLRSGNLLFHDNQYKGQALGNAFVSLVAYRTLANFQPWTLASGDNPWDQNDPHGLYASGTAATASVANAADGITSFYVTGNLSTYNTGGYSVRNPNTGLGSHIDSAVYNATSNKTLITCFYSGAWDSAKVAFSIGSPFQIYRVLRVLDQTGLGAGKLCSTSPVSLNGAVNESSYAWNNNQVNGPAVTIHSGGAPHPTFVQGRDYFNSAPPFAYKAYTYPHPLANDIAPPSNLAIVP
jgi:hypothetical protein